MFRQLIRFTYSLTVPLILITSIGVAMSEETKAVSSISDISSASWKELSTKKIYFGHQSVGYNILDGVMDIMAKEPLINLEVVETHDPKDFNSPLFAHSKVGENGNTQSKIDAFNDVLDNGVGEKTDIALFKFCYLDFHKEIDSKGVFKQYREAVSKLKTKYPNLELIHLTVPLTSQQTGPKAWIKKIIGKPLRGFDINVKRNEFNDFMRAEYKGEESVFDLAKIESTYIDGKRELFTRGDKNYYSLIPDYTDDGSHLNESGRKVVAEQFLLFLTKIIGTSPD